jgi:hypothetical protein
MMIGLIGLIGSGKGTVGDILRDEHGYLQDSFARPLKDAVSVIFGWDRQMLEGVTKDSREWREVADPFWSNKFGYAFTPRLALQLMGTEAGRDVFHESIWVTSLLHRHQGNEDVVVTDVRFRNEIAAIRDMGGMIVRVRRGPDPAWFPTAQSAIAGDPESLRIMAGMSIHTSEWDWVGSTIDHTIYNDGTLADLRRNVQSLAEMVRRP